ncbi:MAG: NAD(+) synthase [bacterium]
MKLSNSMSDWIKERVHKANKRGIIVGLSGGIDSAVTAVLSKRALGDNVLGLILPCESHPRDEELALKVARKFNIRVKKTDLTDAYKKLCCTFSGAKRVVKANLKPRLRMMTLYYLANSLNYLVAGTGNKSELMIGYFTKYGDGGCDILPLGGLLKTEVRKLAQELRIPAEIIQRAPTAGLWEGQTDEGEIGLSYKELDNCLQALEKGKIPKLKSKLVAKIKSMIKNSKHKRDKIPVFKKK